MTGTREKEDRTEADGLEAPAGGLPAPTERKALAKTPVPRAGRRSWRDLGLAVVLVLAAAGGGAYWWSHRLPALPSGIASGNGRIEADPIDIATKFAGRVAELRVDEGDAVAAGQIVAVMDTRDLAASLHKAEAQEQQAQKSVQEAEASVAQMRSQTVLAQREFERAQALMTKGWITKETFDQRQQGFNGAKAAENAAEARSLMASHALEAARHDVELLKINIGDADLVAPRDGRIEYRIANVGEVLPAGGKVFTMLDVSYVYIDVYLPTLVADRIKIGDEARIVLDAFPDRPIPAKVSFLASQAQFTPKMVETQSERDKLMFRVRVRVDPALAKAHADAVRSGLPGVAYVKFDAATVWPERLQRKSQ
jgi:HlyD family secretion protein